MKLNCNVNLSGVHIIEIKQYNVVFPMFYQGFSHSTFKNTYSGLVILPVRLRIDVA